MLPNRTRFIFSSSAPVKNPLEFVKGGKDEKSPSFCFWRRQNCACKYFLQSKDLSHKQLLTTRGNPTCTAKKHCRLPKRNLSLYCAKKWWYTNTFLQYRVKFTLLLYRDDLQVWSTTVLYMKAWYPCASRMIKNRPRGSNINNTFPFFYFSRKKNRGTSKKKHHSP